MGKAVWLADVVAATPRRGQQKDHQAEHARGQQQRIEVSDHATEFLIDRESMLRDQGTQMVGHGTETMPLSKWVTMLLDIRSPQRLSHTL